MKSQTIKSRAGLKLAALMLCMFSIIVSSPAFAGLLITPLQIVIEGRERSTKIILINTGSERTTYRLGWEQVEQSQKSGQYVDSDMNSGALYLQNFAVFTPRQITLDPGDKQTVRVAVRRPSDLADGEYKSHLRFGVVSQPPLRGGKDPALDKEEVRVVARIETSYSLPVVYRVGSYDIDIEIGQPKFDVNENTGKIVATLFVGRRGIHGAIGQVDLYHTPQGGEEVLISSLGNANIFPEITGREFIIPTIVSTLQPGTLRVVFLKAEGQKSNYVVLAERAFPVGY